VVDHAAGLKPCKKVHQAQPGKWWCPRAALRLPNGGFFPLHGPGGGLHTWASRYEASTYVRGKLRFLVPLYEMATGNLVAGLTIYMGQTDGPRSIGRAANSWHVKFPGRASLAPRPGQTQARSRLPPSQLKEKSVRLLRRDAARRDKFCARGRRTIAPSLTTVRLRRGSGARRVTSYSTAHFRAAGRRVPRTCRPACTSRHRRKPPHQARADYGSLASAAIIVVDPSSNRGRKPATLYRVFMRWGGEFADGSQELRNCRWECYLEEPATLSGRSSSRTDCRRGISPWR